MTTRLWLLGLLAAAPAALTAQSPKTNNGRWTIGAGFGGVSATDNLTQNFDWRAGWSAAGSLAYRVRGGLSLRGDATFMQNDLAGAGSSIPGEQRFNKISYLGNVVISGRGINGDRVMPYFLVGAGAVRVHDKGSDSSFTRGAGDLGFGLSYRLGRLGLRAEGRDVMYQFSRFGYNKTQNDMVWQGGVAVRL